jgi:hypothetical protein
MSYKQKKFETPVELHRILGNKYVVGLEERKAKRKQVDVHNVLYLPCALPVTKFGCVNFIEQR